MFSPNPLSIWGQYVSLLGTLWAEEMLNLIDLRQNCIKMLLTMSVAINSLVTCVAFFMHYLSSCSIQPADFMSIILSLMLMEAGGHVILATNTPQGQACVVIKTTSNSITVQPLRLLPSRRCKGRFSPGNCGG